jgi:endonuclease III
VTSTSILYAPAGKALEVEELLTQYYGTRPYRKEVYDQDILGALVATILSQHTSDLNSGRAYRSLLNSYPDGWETVLKAPVGEVADSLRSGGLADVKAARIQQLIKDVIVRTGSASLNFLHYWKDTQEIIEFLKSFSGVGPKTAACVAMFNLGHPVIPVDTHVHRVASRIGLIGKGVSADKAHDDLLKLIEPKDAYSFHVHLIEHGRSICHARNPECEICPVKSCCDFYLARAIDAG